MFDDFEYGVGVEAGGIVFKNFSIFADGEESVVELGRVFVVVGLAEAYACYSPLMRFVLADKPPLFGFVFLVVLFAVLEETDAVSVVIGGHKCSVFTYDHLFDSDGLFVVISAVIDGD